LRLTASRGIFLINCIVQTWWSIKSITELSEVKISLISSSLRIQENANQRLNRFRLGVWVQPLVEQSSQLGHHNVSEQPDDNANGDKLRE
jgi:hypothetical protein